jgi:hypothetical protein
MNVLEIINEAEQCGLTFNRPKAAHGAGRLMRFRRRAFQFGSSHRTMSRTFSE